MASRRQSTVATEPVTNRFAPADIAKIAAHGPAPVPPCTPAATGRLSAAVQSARRADASRNMAARSVAIRRSDQSASMARAGPGAVGRADSGTSAATVRTVTPAHATHVSPAYLAKGGP